MNADSPKSFAIDVRGLRKVYTTRGRPETVAVDGLDLQVAQGEIFGLLGPNGAGKTTTIEICEGLLQPTGGTVRVLGRDWSGDALALRTRIGVTLQETRMFAKQTVRELLGLFAALYDDARDVDSLLAMVALEERPTPATRRCREGRSSASPSPRRSPASPNCCSSTSRPPVSIRSRGARCGR